MDSCLVQPSICSMDTCQKGSVPMLLHCSNNIATRQVSFIAQHKFQLTQMIPGIILCMRPANETTSQCNIISHRLGACTIWSTWFHHRINPWHAELLWGQHTRYIFAFSIISRQDGTGNQNPSPWKGPLILQSISWVLATWQWSGAMASAAMVSA